MAVADSFTRDLAWAWLGDMELDDVLLGLSAAGIFGRPPAAIGFLANAAHCVDRAKDGPGLRASQMYHEKRAFMDAFFGGVFFAILDRLASAEGREWVSELDAAQLAGLGPACGMEDDVDGFLETLALVQAPVLHLLVSGPFLGRGKEIFDGLAKQLRAVGSGRPEQRLVIWMYAGRFNLTHSSDLDVSSLRDLVEKLSPRVQVVETTLKAKNWLCDPPRPFWGTSCPTAWTMDEARANMVGFDMSTDIQSINMFLENYSSAQEGSDRGRALRWLFENIAAQEQAENPGTSSLAKELLNDLEIRSLVTNLTKMVPPKSSSMAKVREALTVSQAELEESYARANALLEKDGRPAYLGMEPEQKQRLLEAAQGYAQLYSGSGHFLEAGCSEFFPPAKPFSGPRLDKRSILRCMARGELQGGATADLLVSLALVLHLDSLDSAASAAASTLGWGRLPPATRELFRLEPSTGSREIFSAGLTPDITMNKATKASLAPLVDAVVDAALRGSRLLRAGRQAGLLWGRRPHTCSI
mmetsp:Transcript_54214/g.117182  ORF Transcript_54214/g.117182 Transcript_54214/m.117182 type:complete len:528 (-) Transcript_54214:98-1681(-)